MRSRAEFDINLSTSTMNAVGAFGMVMMEIAV